MVITLLGIHNSYGIRLWKSGIISPRTTTTALPWLTLFREDASRSKMPVVCGQGIISTYYFLFALNHLFFFVLLGKSRWMRVLLYGEYVFIKLN